MYIPMGDLVLSGCAALVFVITIVLGIVYRQKDQGFKQFCFGSAFFAFIISASIIVNGLLDHY